MNHDEIIAMAREEGLSFVPDANSPLVRIVRKAVAKEREACVQLVEAVKHCEQDPLLGAPVIARAINECADDLADAIRARGHKGGV